MTVLRWCVVVGLLIGAQSAAAQPPAAPASPAPVGQGAGQIQTSDSALVINQKHYIRQGNVEIHDPQSKTDIYADLIEFFEDENRAVATGNVVLAQGVNRIAAERAEFNTKTMLGTFFTASGIATAQPPRQAPRPGAIAPPPLAGQDTLVYFFGETVEKIGPKKYKINNGGFTTCVQPTPRWDMSASTLILNLEHYTLLKNAVMTVKGVPMLYLPVMYYPTKRDNRATGFLIPTYGASTLRGQSLHNAFFWAIDRSQDATFEHDYYSKIGQGIAGEYRYNRGNGNDGFFRTQVLNQHETDYVNSDGSVSTLPADHYFDLVGSASQRLPGHLLARGRVNFPSSIATSQTFNTNIYDLSRNQRSYGGNVVGAWGTYSLNATLDHTEYFYTPDESVLSGAWPRVALTRNERPLLGTPLYFSIGTEYAHLLRDRTVVTSPGIVLEDNQSLGRVDIAPQVRYPFKKWQWFTINSTMMYRETYYTRSLAPVLDPTARPSQIVDEPLNRQFVSLQAQILGPLFNRIWDTPSNGYAEKFKHSVEPFLTIQKTTDVENVDRIVQVDGVDQYTGGTQYTYGINNRFYAKRKLIPGAPAQAREIVGVELSQTYYTNQLSAIYDRQYQTTALGDTTPSNFSPIALSVRGVPTNELTATVRAEFDSRYHALRTISAQGTYSMNTQAQVMLGWSKRGYIPELIGFNDKDNLDESLNGMTTVRTRDSRYGATYSFNYDIHRSSMLQQRITGFYNAQCCGLAFEYQTYNNVYSTLPSDHRFFMSFTLAGLGNFSPFNGALSGVPR